MKNLPVLVPDAAIDKGFVLPSSWHIADVRQMLAYNRYSNYADEDAMRTLLPKDIPETERVVVPFRQVNIGLPQSDGRTVTAWVDTATGRLIQLNQHRSGPVPAEKAD